MRIAISGSHRTGKSTLIDALSEHFSAYRSVDEPYHLLEEEGYEAAHPPALEDFVAQLERSLEELAEPGDDVLFDRCPIDVLAYIVSHEDADAFDLEEWLPRIHEAVQTLDLVVFVPIEARDRVVVSRADDEGGSRTRVDEKLREILLDDPFDLGVDVVEVEGDLDGRVDAVLRRLRRKSR